MRGTEQVYASHRLHACLGTMGKRGQKEPYTGVSPSQLINCGHKSKAKQTAQAPITQGQVIVGLRHRPSAQTTSGMCTILQDTAQNATGLGKRTMQSTCTAWPPWMEPSSPAYGSCCPHLPIVPWHACRSPEVCLPLSHCLAAEGSDMNTIPSS